MVTVRSLDPDDWPLWRALRLRALADSPDAFASTLEDTLARDARDGEAYWRGYFTAPGPALVAELGEEPVGMSRLVAPGSDDHVAHLYAVWVAPEARGRGAGGALLDAAVAWLEERHPQAALELGVVAANAPARRLYGSRGFAEVGPDPDRTGELIMRHSSLPVSQERADRRGR